MFLKNTALLIKLKMEPSSKESAPILKKESPVKRIAVNISHLPLSSSVKKMESVTILNAASEDKRKGFLNALTILAHRGK